MPAVPGVGRGWCRKGCGSVKHGLARSRTHKSWSMMKQRCYNQNAPDYTRYGGLGIRVCERWYDFTAFLTDMGLRPAGKTLDRIDSSKDYSKENCRWATPAQQARNRKRSVGQEVADWLPWAMMYSGVTHAEAAKSLGVSTSMISRILSGEYYGRTGT